jgi:acetyl-CoA synthetase
MTAEDRVAELLATVDRPDVSLADVLCDRHPEDAVAFTVVQPDLSSRDLTYGELKARSSALAAALAASGVRPGDRVATLMGKSSEYVVTVLGLWRAGAVHVPLFTAFAPPAIALRLEGAGAKVVVCDAGQRGKLLPGEDMPADVPWSVVTVGESPDALPGDVTLDSLLASSDAAGAVPEVRVDGDT